MFAIIILRLFAGGGNRVEQTFDLHILVSILRINRHQLHWPALKMSKGQRFNI